MRITQASFNMKGGKSYLANLMILLKRTRIAISKSSIIKSTKTIFILVFAFILAGCAVEPPPSPQMSELQIREIQTRQYENANYNDVMRATIASLQDQKFIITNVNENLGLVTASRDIDDRGWLLQGYQTTKRIEANAFIQKKGKVVEIRINLVQKGLGDQGGVLWTRPLYDAEVYQKIFSKIDKSLFIEKEKVY